MAVGVRQGQPKYPHPLRTLFIFDGRVHWRAGIHADLHAAMENDKHYAVKATIDGAPYRTRIDARGHAWIGDEPREDGGADAGPKAHEMLCGALAACTAITLRMYADRKQWDVGSIEVNVRLDRSVINTTVNSAFRMEVRTGRPLTDEQRSRMQLVAEKCPVHRTLRGPIGITTELV
jgi:putative redox protein